MINTSFFICRFLYFVRLLKHERMKNILSVALLCLLSFHSIGQEIVEDEIDEFTRVKNVTTSWALLVRKGNAYYMRFRKVDTGYLMDIKVMGSPAGCEVGSILIDDRLLFRTFEDSIVALTAAKSQVMSVGGGAFGLAGSGALGIFLTYRISKENLEIIRKGDVYKFRLYTTSGYIEKEIPDKGVKHVFIAASLILGYNVKQTPTGYWD